MERVLWEYAREGVRVKSRSGVRRLAGTLAERLEDAFLHCGF